MAPPRDVFEPVWKGLLQPSVPRRRETMIIPEAVFHSLSRLADVMCLVASFVNQPAVGVASYVRVRYGATDNSI